MGILHLGERQRFRLFVRRDPFERFLSCLIYAPRENYTTELREKWQTILTQAFKGSSSEFNVHLSESALARILITVRTIPGKIPSFDVRELEARLAAVARRWTDDLKQALIEAVGEARGTELARQFGAAFPAAYREDFAARAAVPDIQIVEKLSEAEPLGMSLYRPLEATPGTLRFKLYHLGAPVTLSDSLPMLEHMGLKVLDERPYRVTREGSPPVWMHDLGMQSAIADTEVEIDALHAVFEEAFGRVFRGEVENDDFNRLVLAARLPAQEIVILRSYAKYLRQIGFPLSQTFIEATLASHAYIARVLIDLFKIRFDPDGIAGAGAKTADKVRRDRAGTRAGRESVRGSGAAPVPRHDPRDDAHQLLAPRRRRPAQEFRVVQASTLQSARPSRSRSRCSRFLCTRRASRVCICAAAKWREADCAGRTGPEDFRTEVLGLVKAQMVKNTVIVPVGSKGGFVLKRAPPPSEREAYMKEGVACYQDYLRGLLDITDNRVGEKIVAPPQVKRHDPDDPYLVVAADKGTATFSDYANGISKEYGFWLDDAFASGGSVGLRPQGDGHHRARRVGVGQAPLPRDGRRYANHRLHRCRHRRHVGRRVRQRDAAVAAYQAACGLRSPAHLPRSRPGHRGELRRARANVRAAAFVVGRLRRQAHLRRWRHSFAQRQIDRAHAAGKSGAWNHRRRAGADRAGERDPQGAGGSSLQRRHRNLRQGAKRIARAGRRPGQRRAARQRAGAEVQGGRRGGNLGCTQLGRIEYAMAGGRINTDAIDNSAGVDTSDHEVNIKILLGLAIAEGELTEKQRNALLVEMTDDVAALVLRDNYFQTQALSVTGRIAPQLLDAQQRFIQYLEKAGKLNRTLEFLPSDEEIAERRAKSIGLTSPERAVMLAYSKIWLYDELLASTLPDDEWVETALARYFPKALRERYATYMARHPLKREIIATHVTNSMINRVGSTFVHRLLETTGGKPHEIVRAYLLNREIFGFVTLWQQIEALDNKVDDAVQSAMLIDTARLIDRGTTWFLRSRRLSEDMARDHHPFRGAGRRAGDASAAASRRSGPCAHRDGGSTLRRARACRASWLSAWSRSTRSTRRSISSKWPSSTQRPVELVAEIYFDLATRLGLPWLREMIVALPGQAHWQMLAKGAMLDDLSGLQRTITGEVIVGGGDIAAPDGADRRLAGSQPARYRARRAIAGRTA